MLSKDVVDDGDKRPSWMRDVKRKLQREMLIKQAQPGMAIQSKVHYALQLRRRNESSSRAIAPMTSVSAYSPSIIPFTVEEMKRLSGTTDRRNQNFFGGVLAPISRDRPVLPQSSPLTGGTKLADDVGRQMAQKGYDALSSQMMTSYVQENTEAVERLRRELKLERRHLRKERASLVAGHKHVFPEELLFSGRTTAFPKEPMIDSSKDLTSTRTGGPTKILESCAVRIDEEPCELPPIPIFRSDGLNKSMSHRPSYSDAVIQRSYFGDHFPTYVCQGIPITFDPPTIATLTAQSGRATDAVVSQQVEDFGALEVMPILEELRLLRHLDSGVPTRHSVSPQPESRSRSPSPVHPQGWQKIKSEVRVEELDLMEMLLGKHQDAGGKERRHNPVAKVVEAPEGLLKQLLREVDSDSEASEDELIDQRCVICHAQQSNVSPDGVTITRRTPHRGHLSSLGSSARASEALLRWKALHQLAQVDANESLGNLLASREEQSRIVRKNLKSLAQVADKARRDAEGWLRSRSGTTPVPNNSCWSGPCHRIVQQQHRWDACVHFWHRFTQFLALLQWPQTEAQVELLDRLREIIEAQGYLSPCTLLFWLHACGPQLCKVRENYRVLVYVRAALGLPHSLLQGWAKLPAVKMSGFELASD
jgi:hypothetical protein